MTQIFSSALPPQPTNTAPVEEKTAFISATRTSATQMQTDINAYLTEKMEEDKAQEVAAILGGKKSKDEEREEEMYGEEDVGED